MQVETYLFFAGRCDEAFEFYGRTLGAEVTVLLRYKDSPEPEMCPAGAENKVIHANVRIGKTILMVSDGRCEGQPSFQGFSLSLAVTDEAEAPRLFAALSEGGEVRMPLGKTFWSPCFGMVAERNDELFPH